MPSRPCLDCGRLVVAARDRSGTRCAACKTAKAKAKRKARPLTNAEIKRRAAAVADHRYLYGDWCPGWQREPHDATDLTADHVVPVAAGGDEHGQLAVLCRACNGAKAARTHE